MNRLDKNQKTTLPTLEQVVDFYNSHWWLRVLVHLAYFCYFTYLIYHRYDMIGVKVRGPYMWVFCGFHVVSYYFIFYFLIPKLIGQKQYLWFTLLFLLWYFVPFSYVSFKYNEEIELLNDYNVNKWVNINRMWMAVYDEYGLLGHFVSFIFIQNVLQEFTALFFLLGFFKSVKYYLDNLINEKKLNRLNFDLEAKYLQHQLNPHFLFNSLNNIYGLILQKNKDTPQIISQFQDLLHHSMQQSDSDNIPIQTEIEYLKNYINLEKIRHGKTLQITHNFDNITANDLTIAPRMLLPFVENAFKHGADKSIEAAFINMNLTLKNDQIEFHVENSKPALTEKQNKMGGIGLKNISRRLALLYPNHQLAINNDESTYRIALHLVR